MKLIGINGFKTSGKDTAYVFIEDYANEQGLVAVRRAFADKLKVAAMKSLGYEGDDRALIALADALKDDGGFVNSGYRVLASTTEQNSGHDSRKITGRQFLQLFGQKHRDVFGDNFWIDQVLPDPYALQYAQGWGEGIEHDVAERFDLADYGCITDVRYANEAERILDLDGVVLEIKRPGVESDGHSSERPLPPETITATVVNDGSLKDLGTCVTAFVGSL